MCWDRLWPKPVWYRSLLSISVVCLFCFIWPLILILSRSFDLLPWYLLFYSVNLPSNRLNQPLYSPPRIYCLYWTTIRPWPKEPTHQRSTLTSRISSFFIYTTPSNTNKASNSPNSSWMRSMLPTDVPWMCSRPRSTFTMLDSLNCCRFLQPNCVHSCCLLIDLLHFVKITNRWPLSWTCCCVCTLPTTNTIKPRNWSPRLSSRPNARQTISLQDTSTTLVASRPFSSSTRLPTPISNKLCARPRLLLLAFCNPPTRSPSLFNCWWERSLKSESFRLLTWRPA